MLKLLLDKLICNWDQLCILNLVDAVSTYLSLSEKGEEKEKAFCYT